MVVDQAWRVLLRRSFAQTSSCACATRGFRIAHGVVGYRSTLISTSRRQSLCEKSCFRWVFPASARIILTDLQYDANLMMASLDEGYLK